MRWIPLVIGSLAFAALPCRAMPQLPTDLQAMDTPNDGGKSVALVWSVQPNETPQAEYAIEVAESQNGPWYFATSFPSSTSFKSDLPQFFGFWEENKNFHAATVESFQRANEKDPSKMDKVVLENDKPYFFRLSVKDAGTINPSAQIVSATPRGNWFAWNKLNNFVIMLLIAFFILYYIGKARRNPDSLFIRRIAGLDAVDEALGRATEMGKPVFFLHGIASMADVPTVASVNILGRIAGRVAEYDTTLKVANNDPIVMAVSQETVKESYIKAGRPDAYNADNVFFAAADQFSYAAAVDGMMVREKPAAVFLMGYFYAEALLLSETGAEAGAIQIAGTDAYTQLPFFVTTCDYTLMGEELYAASAYLSREPKLLGSLKGQDVGKGILMVILLAGSILATAGFTFLTNLMKSL